MQSLPARLVVLVLLAGAATAPGDGHAATPPCAPKITFRWMSPTTVRLWTDAEFEPHLAPSVSPPGGAGGSAGPARSPAPEASDLVPILVQVGRNPALQIRKPAGDLFVGTGTPSGSTFLLDLSDEPLVSNSGRAQVTLRNVRCPDQQARNVHVQDAVVMEQHHLAVDVGASFSLDRSGSLPANPEFSLNSYSRWAGAVSGAVDLRITTLEKVAKDSTANQPSFLASGGNTLDVSGRLFLNFDPGWRAVLARQGTQPWLAVAGGLGARSVPGDVSVDARPRYFGGVRLQVPEYNSDQPAESFGEARGHVELGVAHDEFWRDTTTRRLYAVAQIEIPRFGGEYVRLLARVALDRPLYFGNTSASEVRLSVLSSIKPAVLGQLLGFSAKPAAP